MGSKQTRHTGKVIGHQVKFLPKQESKRSGGVMITKQQKVGAFVVIQVDGKKTCTVPARANEVLLDDGQDATDALKEGVYNDLKAALPFNGEVEFVEHVTTREKGSALRRYELVEG